MGAAGWKAGQAAALLHFQEKGASDGFPAVPEPNPPVAQQNDGRHSSQIPADSDGTGNTKENGAWGSRTSYGLYANTSNPISDLPNYLVLFWAEAIDHTGAVVYFERKLIGNFEERAANCSANHNDSSHVTLLK